MTASVQVTRSCSAEFSGDRDVEFHGDCDDRDDRDDRDERNDEMAPHAQSTGGQDNRRVYRIDRDDSIGVVTIQF
ncbi:MAG: hypothetical protein JO322_14205 [Candidatus Eremiobacteraeota bacterium]|nr:hypothetical protein [Candidatus Eremiobacteraeota bacterium]